MAGTENAGAEATGNASTKRDPTVAGNARIDGSVLMLVPAAVLVLIVLGAIAVDSALTFLGQRELDNYTTSAANDSASSGLDARAFYGTGDITVDQATAERVSATLRRQIGGGVRDVAVRVTTAGPTVTVTAVGTVDYLFGSAIPGVRHSARVEATATSTARPLAIP